MFSDDARSQNINSHGITWWRHQMETFSALLTICAGNSPVTGEFPAQRPVTRSFDVFFDLCLNKRLSKQSWGWWFETPSRSLWRHCIEASYPGIFQLKHQRSWIQNIPHSKVHGANMGPIWGRQGPGGPHVGPMNFAIWDNWLNFHTRHQSRTHRLPGNANVIDTQIWRNEVWILLFSLIDTPHEKQSELVFGVKCYSDFKLWIYYIYYIAHGMFWTIHF